LKTPTTREIAMRHPGPAINTTPLIDVLLVLLVLLLITLPRSTHRVTLDLPAGRPPATYPSITDVEIDFNGNVFFGTLETLRADP
jgi:biopolymer transport protein ExbD